MQQHFLSFFLVSIFLSLTIYFLLEFFWVYLSISLFLIGMVLNRSYNREYKEHLNVFRDSNRVYFYLSDDLVFSKELSSDKSLSDTIKESMHCELKNLHDIIGKVLFINFEDRKLEAEVNLIVPSEQYLLNNHNS